MKGQRITHSFVAQARLNPRNPDEAAALDVLQTWLDKGHSMRVVLTEALNALGDRAVPEPRKRVAGGIDLAPVEQMIDTRMNEMTNMIERLGRIVDDLANAPSRGVTPEQAGKLKGEAGEISDRLRRAMHAAADLGDDA
jgi:ferritin-like metal-binding protein YciE